MRIIEKKIIDKMKSIKENDFKTYYLSDRDMVYKDGYGTHYRLHQTVVFSILDKTDNEPRRYMFNSAGWRTPTTKSRMNAMLQGFNIPFGISQVKRIWEWWGMNNGAKITDFEDYDLVSQINDVWVTLRGDIFGNRQGAKEK